MMESTYSVSSFSGLVSSNRRLHFPPYSLRNTEVQTNRLRVPDVQITVGFRRKSRVNSPAPFSGRADRLPRSGEQNRDGPMQMIRSFQKIPLCADSMFPTKNTRSRVHVGSHTLGFVASEKLRHARKHFTQNSAGSTPVSRISRP